MIVRNTLTVAAILDAVSAATGHPAHKIKSLRKPREIVRARFLTYWLAAEVTGYSMPQIAAAMGRDHTSVLHGLRTFRARMETDPELALLAHTCRLTLERLVAMQLTATVADIDAHAVARRVIRNSTRGPLAASHLEVLAMAMRLRALERIAANAARCLRALDHPEDEHRAGAEARLRMALARAGFASLPDDSAYEAHILEAAQ